MSVDQSEAEVTQQTAQDARSWDAVAEMVAEPRCVIALRGSGW